MALSFPQGFTMSHTEPVDNRLVLSKAQMLAIKKAKMPQVYLTVCSDDGKLYLYNSENDLDAETGRFRLFESVLNTDILTEAVVEKLDSETITEKINTETLTETVAENLEIIPVDKI